MKTRTTLLLAVVAVGVFGAIRYYEKHNPGTRIASATERTLLSFNRDAIDEIEILGNEEKIELRKDGNVWELKSPVKDRADQAVVGEILGWCEMLQKEETFSARDVDKKQLKTFGVAKPNLRLKLKGRGAPREILFGKETAVEGRSYLRLDGSNETYVVNNALRNLISRKTDDFRDRRMSDLEGTHVNKLSIKTAAGEIELERTAGHWNLNKPLKARAHDGVVQELIGTILTLPIQGFAPDKGANLNTYGLGEPKGTLSVWALSREEPLTVEVGQPEEKSGNFYSRISSRGTVPLLPPAVDRILALKPNELRDRRLLRVEFDIVDRITVQAAGQPKLILQRKLEDWTLRSGDGEIRPANRAKVQDLARALQDREVSAFVTDVASDLAKYGLDQPQLRVVFSSYSSETTAEGSAGEHPIVTVAFGKEEGDHVYARVEGEPFVVSVPKAFLEEISTDPVAWRSLSIFRLKPEEISSLEVSTPEKKISLVREATGWKLVEGAGAVDEVNVESLLNTVSQLHAVRWIGEGRDALGTSVETLVFKTADGISHRLDLGVSTAEGTRLASIDNEPGVFAISAPDASAFRLPLVN